MAMRSKPSKEEEFIRSASAEHANTEIDIKTRDRTFPLRIPDKLHDLAKEKAAIEKLSLHDYILTALKEKVIKPPQAGGSEEQASR